MRWGAYIIDSGSSADILFGEAYYQMQVGDVSLEKVNTLLYGFAGEVVHPRGMISLPLTMGAGATRKTWERSVVEGAPEEVEAPAKVQPAEELLNIEIIPRSPDKTTQIGSHLEGKTKEEIILCLQRNADIFAWAPQDLEGIDPKVITHHLNIDPGIKPVKQKKRHFGPEKDKIIEAEVDKLMVAGHIEEIQFPKWLSNVVLVPKPGENRECVLTSGILIRIPPDHVSTEDRKKVSFITSSGTFCYVAMPFGLKNAGATYQRLVDKIF
ncbi:UNVERIFIED_CONTAM: hypothetical protein Slati_2702400 [Sesamum latifolium]|uniref:Reverse transcriptase domain-containing protein n=1 Tax=Sesamum latifolium TaxID=2727402 RepID=A0AAW2VZ31_9LAMI